MQTWRVERVLVRVSCKWNWFVCELKTLRMYIFFWRESDNKIYCQAGSGVPSMLDVLYWIKSFRWFVYYNPYSMCFKNVHVLVIPWSDDGTISISKMVIFTACVFRRMPKYHSNFNNLLLHRAIRWHFWKNKWMENIK